MPTHYEVLYRIVEDISQYIVQLEGRMKRKTTRNENHFSSEAALAWKTAEEPQNTEGKQVDDRVEQTLATTGRERNRTAPCNAHNHQHDRKTHQKSAQASATTPIALLDRDLILHGNGLGWLQAMRSP
jgi:hypothetical protein